MLSILLNARLVTDSDGYVRRITLEFAHGRKHKHPHVELLPGMTRQEVALELRGFADYIESECEMDYTESKHGISSQVS